MATKRKLTDQGIMEQTSESDSWHTFIWIWRQFFSRVTDTLRVTWHYWHKLHTVKWQHKLLTFSTCSPHFYKGSQWITTNRSTLDH